MSWPDVSLHGVIVYVGEYGEYPVPWDVAAEAKRLNGNGKRPLTDRRTRGAKHIKRWGRNQDATQETVAAIKRMFPETVS